MKIFTSKTLFEKYSTTADMPGKSKRLASVESEPFWSYHKVIGDKKARYLTIDSGLHPVHQKFDHQNLPFI